MTSPQPEPTQPTERVTLIDLMSRKTLAQPGAARRRFGFTAQPDSPRKTRSGSPKHRAGDK